MLRTIRSELKEQGAGGEVRGARLAEEVPELSQSHIVFPFSTFSPPISRVFFFVRVESAPQKIA